MQTQAACLLAGRRPEARWALRRPQGPRPGVQVRHQRWNQVARSALAAVGSPPITRHGRGQRSLLSSCAEHYMCGLAACACPGQGATQCMPAPREAKSAPAGSPFHHATPLSVLHSATATHSSRHTTHILRRFKRTHLHAAQGSGGAPPLRPRQAACHPRATCPYTCLRCHSRFLTYTTHLHTVR